MTRKHATTTIALTIAAVLSMFALSGCMGFDIQIQTPFDEIEQGIENFERGIEDGFSEYGDGASEDRSDDGYRDGDEYEYDGYSDDRDGD